MQQGVLRQRAPVSVKIRYLDGRRLKRAVLAGIDRLEERREQLNNINVYPVPDADTGTNMALTMRSVADELRHHFHRSIEKVCHAMAESAILGSQGNSGAILAQFIKGLADGLGGKATATTEDFAAAVYRARRAAYEALSKPHEGTILTVMKDWADHITSQQKKCDDFAVLLRSALARARESLSHTPEQLAVLKEHGVVDAGALGFIHLLEGITDYMEAGSLRAPEPGDMEDLGGGHDHFVFAHAPVDVTSRFCTECVVRTEKDVSHEAVEADLEPLGESLVVVSGEGLLKVHIHTNRPAGLFEVMGRYGTILKKKTEDMQAQHDSAVVDTAKVAIIADSACDLPMEYLRKNFISIVPLKVMFGDEVFLDKMEMTPSEFMRKCEVSPHHPKTSQPAAKDYLRAYEEASRRAEAIVVVSLSGGVSGTYQAALTAANQFDRAPVHVVDSATVSVAQGLLVREARRMALEGMAANAIADRLRDLRKRARLFIALKNLDFIRRGGRVGFSKSLIARLLNIKPIIAFNDEGKTYSPGSAFGSRGVHRKIIGLAREEWSRYQNYRIAVAHMAAPHVAEYYVKAIKTQAGLEDVPVIEATPVLGSHSGPGAAAIAVLGLD
jgi:hypothetical protein